MKESLPSPLDVSEYPELAALRALKTNLQVAELALLAAYPNSSCGDPQRDHSEREAYANGILYLINPLVAMLGEYAESVQRLQAWRHREPPGPSDDTDKDIPF